MKTVSGSDLIGVLMGDGMAILSNDPLISATAEAHNAMSRVSKLLADDDEARHVVDVVLKAIHAMGADFTARGVRALGINVNDLVEQGDKETEHVEKA